MPDGIRFDGKDLEQLAHKMRRTGREINAEANKALPVIAGMVAESARTIASENGSAKVAASIRPRATPHAAIVEAGGPEVPLAKLWEVGNKGSKRSAKTFRHPVFGQDVWVDQDKHPFLRPALTQNRPAIKGMFAGAVERAIRRGLR